MYYIVLYFFFNITHAQAQSGNFVFPSSEFSNYGVIDLRTSTSWRTNRSATPGFFSSRGVAQYAQSSDAHHINGYVKHYMTASDQTYRFPVGSGSDLRFVEVGGTVPANGVFATAWIVGDPSTVQDPTDGSFHSTSSVSGAIESVSPVGQWDWIDVNNVGTGVSLSVSIPDVSTFGSAAVLRLVGWNGSQWVSLGSSGATSNTENGLLSGTLVNGITALGIGKVSLVDTDGDGVPDVNEPAGGINNPCLPAQSAGYTGYDANNATWAAADCDGDGVTNGAEATAGSDPYNAASIPGTDTDGDGVPDVNEPAGGINNPCLPAQTAGYTGFSASNATWAAADCDGDGVTNGAEATAGSDPYSAASTPTSDADGDGVLDINEPAGGINNPCLPAQTAGYTGFSASNATWAAADCDGDGVTNGAEATAGSDPYSAASTPTSDADGDGVLDINEPAGGINNPCLPTQTAGYTGFSASNPTWAAADCDGDGFTNGQEAAAGSDPYNAASTPGTDTDGDGTPDVSEPAGGINNPCLPARTAGYTGFNASNAIWAAADCDGDGFTNGAEATAGTDPYNAGSRPIGDLFPNFTFGNTSYLATNQRFVIININEIQGFATSGPIQFFIPNVSGFQLNFDNTLTTATILAPESVNNTQWTVTDNGIGLLFSSNTTIPAGGRSRIALRVTALTSGSVANLTVNIAQGSGGETNTANNVGVLSQSIQN